MSKSSVLNKCNKYYFLLFESKLAPSMSNVQRFKVCQN